MVSVVILKRNSYSKTKILDFDRNKFYKNPHPNFNYPPLSFDELDDNRWTTLAKAIVTRESGLKRYVDYAQKFKLEVQIFQIPINTIYLMKY